MSLRGLRVTRSFPAICAVTLAAFSGCASSTMILSQPSGARVRLNGADVGQTPYTMSDSKIVGSSTQLRLEHPGYQPLDVTISRNEELDVLALVGGLFLWVPFLWVMKYKPTHSFQLNPAQAAAQLPVSGPAGYPALPPSYPRP